MNKDKKIVIGDRTLFYFKCNNCDFSSSREVLDYDSNRKVTVEFCAVCGVKV